MPFRALNLSPQIMQAVRDAGYTEPTPIQVAAIPLISAGHDIIGIAQTGTGKTAAFVLPILMKLAESKQTVTQAHNAARNRQSGSAPGPRALGVGPSRGPMLQIEELTHQFQRSPRIVQIGRRANPAETVTQFAYEVPPHLKSALLLHLLGDPKFDTVLVFTRTKRGADKIARRLESSGIKTGTIHSNRSQNQRLRALKDFKSGAVRVLVATDRRARHRCGWDLACGELRFPDALGGLCPSHWTHRPRARHR